MQSNLLVLTEFRAIAFFRENKWDNGENVLSQFILINRIGKLSFQIRTKKNPVILTV